MRIGAGKYHFLRGGGGEGLELFTEAKAAFSAIFAGVKIVPLPGRRPLHGTAGRAGDYPLPLFPNGIAAGGKRDNRKVSVGCQICGFFCKMEQGNTSFCVADVGRVRGCGPRQKRQFPPPLPTRKSSHRPVGKSLRGTVDRAAVYLLLLFPNGIAAEGKEG